MGIDSLHPTYLLHSQDWCLVRDCYAGARTVKSKGALYLPPTKGMILDGMRNKDDVGYQMYEAYRLRAVWHDLFKEAVEAYIGILHQKPPTITLPAGMEGVVSNNGETPEQLLRRINEEQLVTGRVGLLTDMPLLPDQTNPAPYIAMYGAESIRNWDVAEDESEQVRLNYVVLDESGYERSPTDVFVWSEQTRYRVCQVGNILTPLDGGEFSTGLFKSEGKSIPGYDPEQMIIPALRGTKLNFIPFVFINSKDLLPGIDESPLLGLAEAMIAMYRGEADYRQNLFMQGQDTLVTIGGVRVTDSTNPDAPLRTGAGSRIDMEMGGDAKYVGVSGEGLPEQRTALATDRSRAEIRAGQLVNTRVGDKESGEALKTRLAAQTATLKQIAMSGATGLETALKYVATWMGKDPKAVKVEPNLEFTSTLVTGQDMFQLMQAKDLGLPISYESLHEYMVDRGITKLNFATEFEKIAAEKAKMDTFKSPLPTPPAPAPVRTPAAP